MEVQSLIPFLVPAIPSVCAYSIFLAGKSNSLKRYLCLTGAILQFLITFFIVISWELKGVIYVTKALPFLPGIGLLYRADPLGLSFSFTLLFLWIIAAVYTLEYMKEEEHSTRFFGFFSLCVAATTGVAFSGNLITLFFVYEALTICSYPLIVHRETPESLRAGKKYLIYAFMGEILILLAIVITQYLTGTISLDKFGILTLSQGRVVLYALFALYIIGFGVKATIIPFHGWLPSCYVAPIPVSALLHSVIVVNVGVFGILRVVYNVFGVELMKELGLGFILACLAAFTIIAGSIMALLQDNLKKRLAYSTVSQMSYIILGAALLAPAAAIASIIHITNHAFQKIIMFFVVGAIEKKTGKQNISELTGIGYQMPVSMACFTVAALGFIGIPLLAGFITKWYLFTGVFQANQSIFAVVIFISSLLNAVCWLPIVSRAYFKGSSQKEIKIDEVCYGLLCPIIIGTIGIVWLGILSDMPGMPVSLALVAVQNIFGIK
jgi:formate hydrogenlyase subunit 3/multisubunit Na+/H+ antiporter MnhD subunit